MEFKEREFIVDYEFIKERDKILDKQVKHLKSKGYEMGNSYYEWYKDIGGDNCFMQYIDLASHKCYIYLSDIEVRSTRDIKVLQTALKRVQQDYLEIMGFENKQNE